VKSFVFSVGMVFLLFGASGCGSSADGLVKDEIKYMNEMADAIEKKDEAKTKELKAKLEETEKKLNELKLSDDDKKKLIEANKDELTKATQRVVEATMKGAFGDIGKGFGVPNMPAVPGFPGFGDSKGQGFPNVPGINLP
jgi:hypothetical protein